MSACAVEPGFFGHFISPVDGWPAPLPTPVRFEELPAASPEVTRVLIVAEDPLARAGLAALLADEPDCLVVGTAAPDASVAALLDAAHPDVLLWDVGRGRAFPEDLVEAGEAPPLLLLLPPDTTFPRVAGEGVRGCLPRDADALSVVAALRAIARGLMVFDPAFAQAPSLRRGSETVTPTEELTPRETGVLQLLAEGLPNKAIAEQLGISEHTVKFHINAIFGKLDAHSRTEAVTRAARLGLIVL